MLVLTQGKLGAVLYTANDMIEKNASTIVHVEDTIGAGDIFHSAFLASLSRAETTRSPHVDDIDSVILSNALEFACTAAGLSVSRAGCFAPSQSEVEKFVR